MNERKMTSLMLIPVMKELEDHEIKFYVGQIDFYLESKNDIVDVVILEPGNDDWNDRCKMQCPQYTLYNVYNNADASYCTKLSTDAKILKLEDTEKIVNSYTVFTGESLFPRTYIVKVRVYL